MDYIILYHIWDYIISCGIILYHMGLYGLSIYRRILLGIIYIYGDGDYLGILSIVRVIWMTSIYDVD